MPGAVRLLIADDHAVARQSLRELLRRAGFDLISEAATAEAAIDAITLCEPDVVLMELSLPAMGGAEATRRIRAAHPRVAVLALTSAADATTVLDAVDAGVSGYLLKDDEPPDLVAAIRAVCDGGSPFSPKIAGVLVEARNQRHVEDQLTVRELETLELVADGLPNKQIAARLGISEATVKAHLGSAFRRIGVRRRTEAALWMRSRRPAGPAHGVDNRRR